MTPIAHGSAPASAAEAARAIEAEFAVALGSEARVAAACDALRGARARWDDPLLVPLLQPLAALLASRTGPLVAPLFDLLEEIARGSPDPWPLLGPMLRAGPQDFASRALEALLAATDQGRLDRDDRLIASVSAIAEARGSPFTDRPGLDRLARLLGDSPVERFLHSPDAPTRRLAARILDRTGQPPGPALAGSVLGEPAQRFLAPYLDFTRATHLDLLALAAPRGGKPLALQSLRDAEATCGPELLREAIAALGWAALNVSLEARPLAGISIGGGIPLLLPPAEAAIIQDCPGAARLREHVLFVAHGSHPDAAGATGAADVRVERFRASNLRHAQVLAEFLDLAPVTRARVEQLLLAVGELVADFVALFPGEADECRKIQAAFEAIASRVRTLLAESPGGAAIPAEAVRLVQPFEDPASIDTVRTLHGMKRYLHQRGLRLGFQLVQGGRHATQSVSLAIATNGHVTRAVRRIEFADFDPEPQSSPGAMPYAVRVVAEGFARQLLHGVETLPLARVFCYQNEVHYFISFRNHPAFVRIDYSPPFAGGMIDLEYYGVSKYELSHHPNMSLDGIAAFFRRLDFDVSIENTRIHARYDKERARDLGDLCARAEALFHLVPYLMDVDWVLGGLDLSLDARNAVAAAWADRFARWGVLPLHEVLSADRRNIRLREAPHPAGPRDRTWRGDLPYRDRLVPEGTGEALAWMRQTLRARGLDVPSAFCEQDIAQIPLETTVLAPLRDRAGEEQPHDASRFAALAASPDRALVEAGRLARVLAPLDRFLQFETTGCVSAHLVQSTRLALPGRALRIAVLRDDSGAIDLALADEAPPPHSSLDTAAVATILRSHHFPVGEPGTAADLDADCLARRVSARGAARSVHAVEGERVARGVRAAPGTAAGLARLGTAHRVSRDVEGSVLVTERLSPEDGPFLTRAAGVVCTGGGVLSHAGLLAAQFGKPALVIDARWIASPDAAPRVQFWSVDFNEIAHTHGSLAVVERRGVTRREEWLRDGDLVEVDADDAAVRVLGQDREALALFDALRQLEVSEARLATAHAPEQVLAERGRRAHALHQLSRLLPQLVRPDLVSFAVKRLMSGAVSSAGSAPLLASLFAGRAPDAARAAAGERLEVIAARYERSCEAARERIGATPDAFEILALRLDVMKDADALQAARAALQHPAPPPAADSVSAAGLLASLDRAVADRLRDLSERAVSDLSQAVTAEDWPRARGMLAGIDRLHGVLEGPAPHASVLSAARERIGTHDRAVRSACGERRVLTVEHGGAELRPLVGPKASNLAEVARLDPTIAVPPWFAISHAALNEALAVVVPDRGIPLGDAIAEVLSSAALEDRQRARAIERLWDSTGWPAGLDADIRAAYGALTAAAAGDPDAPRSADGALLVAVRSSAFEEDRPDATAAGVFDTFLYVGGEDAVLAHVKKAWSGFWTARAIHNRALLGIGSRVPGGGILVQRMIDARSAGVVQTINVADGRPREIAIDVAFGLGEGVVSGRVAADHVIVVKEDGAPAALRFRYATADKRERIVFDPRRGTGTCRADTLYHQRMRPALEYPELEALVHVAGRLERLWCEALDLEFAIDAQRLWVLQARPVPAYHAAWHETARRYPIQQEARP